ncbi:MAG: ABC transporter ATP-binding protein [Lachnospiraceae bacterium]|nr:ABC transporter ATP-binding protein [Lachnospiraceae bacterium]
MLGEAGMDLFQPSLMATIVDDGVLGLNNGGVGNLQIVIHTGLQMIGLIFVGAMCGILSGVFSNLAAQRFGNDVRKDAFSSIMHLSFSQTDHFTTGSLITRVTNDVTQVQNMVQMVIRIYVRTVIMLIGGIICMTRLNLSFGLVLLLAMPLIIVVLVLFLSKITPNFTTLQQRLDDVNNIMQENVSGNRVVKAYHQEGREQERFGTANHKLIETQLRILFLLNYMNPIMNIILNLSVIAIIWIGRLKAETWEVQPGHVMAAITYLTQILNAMMRLGMMFQNISRGMASSKRLREVIDTVPEIRDGEMTEKREANLLTMHGQVEFRHVSFAYAGHEEILKDINLTIAQGETIGILGMTGSGKTSLVNLIPRFYDVTAGSVLVDGVDVRNYPLSVLRSKIAVALQKSEIMQKSIRENIAWGNSESSEEEIRKAAEIAQAMEFIVSKEEGLDTQVAQSGHSLSGGQKQRLAIARAVLKHAEILILDDSTSALDLKTEGRLYQCLKAEYPDITKIIIAQRIASVRDADRILVLEDGRIAACGSHDELLSDSSIYRDIYESQIGGVSHG